MIMTLPEVLEIKIYETNWDETNLDKLSDKKLFMYCRLTKESAFVKTTREPESDDERVKKMPLLFSVREFLGVEEEDEELRLNTLLSMLSFLVKETWIAKMMKSELLGIDLSWLSDDAHVYDKDDSLYGMIHTGLSIAYAPIDDCHDEFLEQLQDYIRKLIDKIRK